MANRLEMATVQAIRALWAGGWSIRRIARELGIDRQTVSRYVRQGPPGSKPANAPSGFLSAESTQVVDEALPTEGDYNSKPANAPTGSVACSEPGSANEFSEGWDRSPSVPCNAPPGSLTALADARVDAPVGSEMVESRASENLPGPESFRAFEEERGSAGRRSDCEPWREVVLAKLELGLSAQRIYQDLVGEHGYAGSYFSVRRFVRRLGSRTELPMRRMECAPGEEAQVDFGAGAPVLQGGKRRRPHVFRIVLSYSRKAYSESVYRQTTEEFLRCLENAFVHFGGVPRTLVIDNLRAAVTKPDWFDPELSPKVQSFCAHYGVALLPTKPYMPRHKGKVERGIGYVKGNALAGKTFATLEAQNRHLAEWEANVADKRIHGTTRQQVGKVFREVERSQLLPLPKERFPFFHEARRSVHRDGHIEVEKAFYSAPPEYVGRLVWARWDARTVRIFSSQMEQLAVHVRREPGQFSTLRVHLDDRKISTVERGALDMLAKARRIGKQTAHWAEAMLQTRGIEGLRVLLGLLGLAQKHPPSAIERACKTALGYGAYRLRTVRQLIARQEPHDEQQCFLDEHPIIRRLSDYGDLVRSAIHKEVP